MVLPVFQDRTMGLAWKKHAKVEHCPQKREMCGLCSRHKKPLSFHISSMTQPRDSCLSIWTWSCILTLTAQKSRGTFGSAIVLLPSRERWARLGATRARAGLEILFCVFRKKRKERISPGNGRAALDNKPPMA